MANEPKDASIGRELTQARDAGGGFLERAFAHLPQEKQEALVAKAVEGQIQLDQKRQEAADANRNSREEMGAAVEHIRNHVKTGADFTYHAHGKTASGGWESTTSKSNAKVILVIAITIGIVAVFILSR